MILIVITIACFVLYMGGLFWLALKTEKGNAFLQKCSLHPVVYASALGIYCTTWTYYGSVGKAATSGFTFLAIYFGPVLAIFFWPLILRKMARIKHEYHTTSIADFISARYNRSQSLAAVVTLIALIGVIPYITLQLRATITTFNMLSSYAMPEATYDVTQYMAWLIIGLMVLFTILFGARRLDPTETHKGMIISVSIQSIVQLVALLCVGIYVTYFLYDGFSDIFSKVETSNFAHILHVGETTPGTYMVWVTYMILAMSAIMFLPRQFHVAVVENPNENHIKTALWCFPLYMFLMNLFIVPIAMGGLLSGLPASSADSFVLQIPLANDKFWLALVAFLGGISAAVSMIMISSMTIATMVTNHWLLPLVSSYRKLFFLKRHLLECRWFFITALVIVSYLFEGFLQQSYMLVNIGLISFAAVLQFAPCIIGGLYWRQANKRGAMWGLWGGFFVWFYTLLLPAMVKSGWLSMSILSDGPWGITCLKPEDIFCLPLDNKLVHSVFWSMLINITLFVFASLSVNNSEEDKQCAHNFVDIMSENESIAVPEAFYKDETVDVKMKKDTVIASLLQYFHKDDVKIMLDLCLDSINLSKKEKISVLALAEFQNQLEKNLTGSLGSAAAHQAVHAIGLFTENESEELKKVYGEILSDLKLSPQELLNKIDFYKEKEELLIKHARELEAKLDELNEQIKERHLAEKALVKSENKYRILIENLPQRIFRKDKQGVYNYCNSVYAKDLGINREDIIGKTDYDFHPKELADKYREDDLRVLVDDVAEDFEEEYRKDGMKLWVRTVKVPIKNENGVIEGILGIFWDVTERHRAAKMLEDAKQNLEVRVHERTLELSISNKQLHFKIAELEKTKEELEIAYTNLKEAESQLFQAEKLASIGQLAAGVAHEINNPIGFISSNTDVLQEYLETFKKQSVMIKDLQNAILKEDKEEISILVDAMNQFEEEENIEFILKDTENLITESKEGLDRVKKIIVDLRSFSRDDKGAIEPVDINANIKSILGILNNEIKYRCEVIEEYGDIPKVRCSPQKIGQVVMNLVMNAAQSFEDQGKIFIRTYSVGQVVFIEVEDNGCGIPEEGLGKIFDPFFTTKEVGKGTGLGLSISYEIVKKHHGDLIVESKVNEGTKFIIKLPLDCGE